MGVKSYIDCLLLRGQNLGLGVISDAGKVGWAFFKMMNFEDIVFHYDLFCSLQGGSASSKILAETATTWWNLNNEIDKVDVIREEDSDKIIQYFLGIYPPQLRLFMQYQANQPRGNLSKVKVPSAPTALSHGYRNGYMTPFEEPTELGQIFTLKQMDIQFAWYNPEPSTDWLGDNLYLKPELNIIMRRFDVKAYDPKRHADKIRNMFSGAVKCAFWSPGSDAITYPLETNYKIEPTPWPGVD